MMDAVTIQYIFSGLLALVFWYHRKQVNDNERHIEQLQRDINNVKLEYIHKNDFREFKLELRNMFEDLKKDIKGAHE